ncbi:MAG: electron transport complex subunit E [Gammaproteobacteria bacterium]|jgi:electron transport complex protein RnfE|nr:electron transport complex subunit E [Gammaproteobacteria bacterium]MDH5514434.1 electron transport complex subunit E [Gammaproteobacteria bacterium]HSG10797.1 electron transport complex subunit E [Gammaproteobacteria bacterium]
MSKPALTTIVTDGLWTNNPGIVQLLGLCPLLAVTTNMVNGLGLGLATTLTLLASNATVSLIRRLIRPEVRIPVFVLIIASVVTVIELAMNAWLHDLYKVLGIFIPLIVTNCAIIGRAESFASRNPVDRAIVDALAMGIGFTLVLVVLGGMRELLGQGTLLSQAHMMFGEAGRSLTLTLVDDYRGFLLAILPPGAFIGLGFIIAGVNIINSRRQRQASVLPVPSEQPSPA